MYTPPFTNIPLHMAASGKEAIQIAGRLTDGLITTSKPNNSDNAFEIFNKGAIEKIMIYWKKLLNQKFHILKIMIRLLNHVNFGEAHR